MAGSTSGLGEAARSDRVSFWVASAPASSFEKLEDRCEADVVVVGAGIVGLTVALLLAEAGKDVLVVEADRIAAGVSGYTSAKVTAGHGLIYSHLDEVFDSETARLYAESQVAGLSLIRELCEGRSIACDFEPRPNYLFAETKSDLDRLEREAAAAARAGLLASLVSELEIPVPSVGGLRLDDQAQFHVRKYLLALAALVIEAGGRIVESSRVTEVSGEGPYLVSAATGAVGAASVVVASHYPVVQGKFFAKRIHPRRSYIVAAPLSGEEPLGMFINVSRPTRSFRTTPLPDGGRLLLVGGEGHRVGQEDDTESRYEILEGFMREHFAVGDTAYRWSTQDNFTLDGLPFVGRAGGEGQTFVATGFGGWGMTNGAAAALAISDAIQGRANQWSAIFDLERHSVLASAGRFVTENTHVGAQAIAGHLPPQRQPIEEIETGQGVVTSIDGADVAVSRGPDGSLHAVSASCTHMGCRVSWNSAESTWDCPCHGSRFASDGRVLHGPAPTALETINLDPSAPPN